MKASHNQRPEIIYVRPGQPMPWHNGKLVSDRCYCKEQRIVSVVAFVIGGNPDSGKKKKLAVPMCEGCWEMFQEDEGIF